MNFPPFRIDRQQGRLWRGAEVIPLRRKAWEVLLYLIERPGELVTKDDLLTAVWGDTAVQEAVITNCVSEIRRALGDDWRAPRLLEVVHRRGFRWIAAVTEDTPEPVAPTRSSPLVVGREYQLLQLGTCFTQALTGQRQIVFVTGEPGIGKTTLIEQFLKGLAVNPAAPYLLARGQCLEILGAEEPYLPVLDAIARLCSESQEEELLEVLRRCAPTWIAQMPWLLDGEAARAIERVAAGATQERMLRELATALETLAARRAVILLLEDLHWADPATLDLFSYLARRAGTMRVLMIGTYRAADAVVRRSPLIGIKQELLSQNRAVELALDHLDETAVQQYLDHRFGSHALPPSLTAAICRHTDGHPMFMDAVVNELVQRGSLVEREQGWQATVAFDQLDLGLPASLKRALDCQVERLAVEDLRLLEAASVAGIDFSSQELAAALERNQEDIEDQCDQLVEQQQFVRATGWREWPDGSSGARYAFLHALHQRALYQRLPESRRRRLHRRIGDRLEHGYQTRPAEVANELAAHFECAADSDRCCKYLVMTGRAALRRANPQAASARFARALEMVAQMAPGPQRSRREIEAWCGTTAALQYLKGLGPAEVRDALARVEVLCRDLDESDDAPLLFEALYSAWGYHFACGEVAAAASVAGRLATIGRSLRGDGGELCAWTAEGATQLMRGDFAPADEAFERALRTSDTGDEWAAIVHYIPRVQALVFAAHVAWLRGYGERAGERIARAGELACALTHPLSEMFVLDGQLQLNAFARDEAAIAFHSDKLSQLAVRYDLPMFVAIAGIYRSWVSARHGNADAFSELEAFESMMRWIGFEWSVLEIGWLRADALVKAGHFVPALALIDITLQRVEATGAWYLGAELYRLRGEALASQASDAASRDAEQSIRRAIALAEHQDARWWELRARISLARLLGDTPAGDVARRELGSLCERFSEAGDTPDVQEACLLTRR